MSKTYPPTYGESSNRIPYVKFGSGQKILLLLSGGPGNILPKGLTYSAQVKDFLPLCKHYTIYLLMRKIGLKSGDTTESMAKDYAVMINNDFGGHVDVMIGYSYGGLIVQHFAADFPGLCPKTIILSSTNENKEQGLRIDTKFAEYLCQRKSGKAFALMMDVIMDPGLVRSMAKILMRCIGFLLPLPRYPEFVSDVKIELDAEIYHDASIKYKQITHPILVMIGTKDYYFSVESAQWMCKQIPNAKLVILSDIGHEITSHKDFIKYIFEYLDLEEIS